MGNRLLWVGCSPSHIGGQSRVSYFSIRELKKFGWDVSCCGKGSQILNAGEESMCPCYAFNEYDPQTLFSCIDKVAPDIIIFSHDVWLFYCLPEIKAKYPNIKIVGWWTIDCHPIHSSWLALFRCCDRLLVPTEFGKRVIYERYPEKSIEVVPYGVELDTYKLPEVSRIELKKDFLKSNNIPEELSEYCFFTTVSCNQIKKNIGAMVDAFASFGDRKAILLLGIKSILTQIGPFQFEGEYDLKDMIGCPNVYVINSAMDNTTHAKFLQMSDFYLYPSQGESPGLQMAESQLCGCIPLATDYTGLPEETCYPQFLIKDFQFHRGQFNCYRAMVSAESLRAKMIEAYAHWMEPDAEWTEYKYNLVQEKFSRRGWDETGKKLNLVLRSTLEGSHYDPELVAL